MLKKLLGILVILALGIGAAPSFAANPKAGSSCSKLGSTQVLGAKKFTCVAKGSKKVWNSGVLANGQYAPKGYAGGRCEEDPLVKGQGAQVQKFLSDNALCVQAMRVAKASLPIQSPKSQLSDSSVYANLETCKLTNAPKSDSWKGFPDPTQIEHFNRKRHPSPGTVMQIIPIYSSDAPARKKSPYQDYKYYFDLIKDYFKYIDDSGTGIELRVPDKYLEFPEAIGKFEITHGKDDQLAKDFVQKVVTAVDSTIDFTDVGYALIVVPGGTPSSIMAQQGFGGAKSAEKFIFNISAAQPATFTSNDENSKTMYFATPSLWLHEFYHPGMNLGDNHGGDSLKYDDDRGMGDWGLMSRNNGDLLAWQKWFLGFITDKQVKCHEPSAPASVTWLAPSSVKTDHQKLVVVPLSKTKAIVVESIRATGLNYRLNTPSLGALVYEVDSGDPRHMYGYKLLYPDNRRPKLNEIVMEDGPLKVGESVTYEGVKITNVEWGDFGDVIKIEPVK